MRLSIGEVRKRRRGGRRVGWKRELKSEGGEGRKEGKESEGERERERKRKLTVVVVRVSSEDEDTNNDNVGLSR